MENEINQYVSTLIKNKRFKRQEYCNFIANDYEFPIFLEGKLNTSTALLLLKKARYDRKLQCMTQSLLYYCDANTFSLDLLKTIDFFPHKIQYSYFSSLVHCDLTFTQFWCINERVGTEAFEDLFDVICEKDFFSPNDMRMLLENKNYTKHMLKYCVEDAEDRYGCIAKIEMARKYL